MVQNPTHSYNYSTLQYWSLRMEGTIGCGWGGFYVGMWGEEQVSLMSDGRRTLIFPYPSIYQDLQPVIKCFCDCFVDDCLHGRQQLGILLQATMEDTLRLPWHAALLIFLIVYFTTAVLPYILVPEECLMERESQSIYQYDAGRWPASSRPSPEAEPPIGWARWSCTFLTSSSSSPYPGLTLTSENLTVAPLPPWSFQPFLPAQFWTLWPAFLLERYSSRIPFMVPIFIALNFLSFPGCWPWKWPKLDSVYIVLLGLGSFLNSALHPMIYYGPEWKGRTHGEVSDLQLHQGQVLNVMTVFVMGISMNKVAAPNSDIRKVPTHPAPNLGLVLAFHTLKRYWSGGGINGRRRNRRELVPNGTDDRWRAWRILNNIYWWAEADQSG